MTTTGQSAQSTTVKNSPQDNFSKLLSDAREIARAAITEAAETDATDSFPAETFCKLADAEILEAVIPKNYGAGLGIEAGTTETLLTLLKFLGYGNLVVGRIFEGHFNAWQLIGEYGIADQVKKFAEQSRRNIFGVWNTEAGGGVEIFPDAENNLQLKGAKTFASGVGYVTRPIVTGKFSGGWQMCVVPLEKVQTSVDDSWWKPLGMQASRSYRVDFSGVRIPIENLLGKPDDYYRQPFFSGGAIRFAAVQLGAAEFLFDQTREFLRQLKRTNDPFQQMRLGEMAIAVESGNQWLKNAARIFDEYLAEKNAAQIERVINYAGMMRTAIEQICQSVIINCERSIGSRGLLKPYHFERVIRDLKTYLRQAAPDATLTGIGDFVLKRETPSNEGLWQVDER